MSKCSLSHRLYVEVYTYIAFKHMARRCQVDFTKYIFCLSEAKVITTLVKGCSCLPRAHWSGLCPFFLFSTRIKMIQSVLSSSSEVLSLIPLACISSFFLFLFLRFCFLSQHSSGWSTILNKLQFAAFHPYVRWCTLSEKIFHLKLDSCCIWVGVRSWIKNPVFPIVTEDN